MRTDLTQILQPGLWREVPFLLVSEEYQQFFCVLWQTNKPTSLKNRCRQSFLVLDFIYFAAFVHSGSGGNWLVIFLLKLIIPIKLNHLIASRIVSSSE